MYTYNHKTSPGFCAELSHRQSIHIMVMGGFAGQIILFTTNDLHSPLFLILHMTAIAWIKKIFLGERGGGKEVCVCVPRDNCLFAEGGGHDRSMHLLTLMVPIII